MGQIPNLPQLRTAINEESCDGSVREMHIPASVPPPEKDPKEKLVDEKDLDRVLSRNSLDFGTNADHEASTKVSQTK